jgi:hypothetical protein
VNAGLNSEHLEFVAPVPDKQMLRSIQRNMVFFVMYAPWVLHCGIQNPLSTAAQLYSAGPHFVVFVQYAGTSIEFNLAQKR